MRYQLDTSRCLWGRSPRTICRSFPRACRRRAQSPGLTMALTVVGSLREAVSAAFGDVVQFTPVPGEGTLVEVPPIIDEKTFQEVTRVAIAAAQQKRTTLDQ